MRRGIQRLLIANRGEIALRVMHTCREMGIESVAVYSEADAHSPFVAAADKAVAIGPAPARESYLAIPKIIDAARASGADAIHPGYGFLSENAEFADACQNAGLIFVGPPPEVIAAMGSKIESRRIMKKAGIPIVPGEIPTDQSDEGIRAAIKAVGIPALVKASAGGGGKGMRQIDALPGDAIHHTNLAGKTSQETNDVPLPDFIDEAIQSARREALASFGDDTLYVERLIRSPRHIEVQVFADAHDNVVHLFERECSVQRRHQKVIEESPSPDLKPQMRVRLTAAAVKICRMLGYQNAGTIEFLLDGDDPDAFYFLEMNTRLQVEHPVTEAVTGVDMVRGQILVASGKHLPWAQRDLSQRGHAIECRIYAEDPARDFMPQAGRLLVYREPRLPGLRIDSGVVEGGEVSVYYDPLLAKLIATGENREAARLRAIAALRQFPILGIHTNVAFLLKILRQERFVLGNVDTAFLDREGAAIAEAPVEVPEAALAAAAANYGKVPARENQPADLAAIADPWLQLEGWRN